MLTSTLLPIGTMIYFKGCKDNPYPDLGWVISHEPDSFLVYCNVRDEEVHEPHYIIGWADGSQFRTTHDEISTKEFLILEETCK